MWQRQPLDWPEGVSQFVRVWFGEEEAAAARLLDRVRTDPQLQQLARVPLTAGLLCWMWQSDQFPAESVRRTWLLESCLRRLLSETCREKDGTEKGLVDPLEELLAELAFRTFRGGRWAVTG